MIQSLLDNTRQRVKQVLVAFRAQPLSRQMVLIAAAGVGLAVSGIFTLFMLVWSGMLGHVPDRDELSRVENPLATEVYSADSVLLGRYFVQERSNINYADLPQHLIDAVIATEDVRFYEHGGIDRKSLLRVLVKSIMLQQESSGGGSTLTQQLAKNLFPRRKYALFSMPINKIREMIIATRLEAIYDKKALLTLYLNTVPFGDNTYGIEAAAQRFFSVRTRQLSVNQSAVLVGMLKASSMYNPRLHPERSQRRRNVVLEQMEKYEMLRVAETDSLKALPLVLKYNHITHHSGLAPYFREYIRGELAAWCEANTKANGKSYDLYTDGLKVYTTIDARMQQYAEQSVSRQMTNIQRTFNDHWGKRDPWHAHPALLAEAVRRSDRYRGWVLAGKSEEEIDKLMKTPVLMSILTPDGEKEVTMSPLDSVRHFLKFLQAGVLAMEPRSGAVRLWVGGINHHFFQYDHVRETTKRQIGSTFKPIVYAAALEQGVQPCDFVSAARMEYTNLGNWSPENTENNYDLKYSLTGGLTYSVNTVSVRVLEMAGIGNTIALARRMGIESELPEVPSIALGTPNISMMEMVRAYACFVNGGTRVDPFYITTITDHQGKVLDSFQPSKEKVQALSPETAQTMVEMLKHTVNEGTAVGLRARYGIQNDIAGKTGTTQANADGWFMAMTPRLVIGAWVGADDPRIRFRSTALGQGSRTALPIVADFFRQVNADRTLASISKASFPVPAPSVSRRLSCDLYKNDETVLEKIFGKRDRQTRRAFGDRAKKKKSFLRRLFGS